MPTPAATRYLCFKVVSKRSVTLSFKCRVFGKRAITTYCLDVSGLSGAGMHNLSVMSERSTTVLPLTNVLNSHLNILNNKIFKKEYFAD